MAETILSRAGNEQSSGRQEVSSGRHDFLPKIVMDAIPQRL
jgi:hypothetical protein